MLELRILFFISITVRLELTVCIKENPWRVEPRAKERVAYFFGGFYAGRHLAKTSQRNNWESIYE